MLTFHLCLHCVTGPKTVFFWAPLMKWCLVAAGLKDLNRPAEKLSVSQNVGASPLLRLVSLNKPHLIAVCRACLHRSMQLWPRQASSGSDTRSSLHPSTTAWPRFVPCLTSLTATSL